MWIHACGLIHSTLVTGPRSVTGALASNSAENAWWANRRDARGENAAPPTANPKECSWHVTTSELRLEHTLSERASR